ncbi:hypothetical protein ACHAQJ_006225 [Trichoderma viride]
MGLFKGRTGAGATMHNPNFSEYELAHSSTPTYAASEEGPQKWADERDYKYAHKPQSSSRSLRSVTAESTASPRQNHSPYLSSGLDANSAAGRLRHIDQFGFSRSTDQISLQSKTSLSSNRSASTKPWEAKSYRQYHIPIRTGLPSPESNPRNTPTSSLMVPSLAGGDETPTGIGMALGSPSHPPGSAESPWQSQVLTTVTSGGHAPEPAPNPGLSRSMSKRWNPFSRTKSKRSKPAENSASRAPGSDSGNANGTKNGDASEGGKKKGEKESDNKGTGSAARKDSSSSVSRSPTNDIPGLPNQRDPAAPMRNPPVPPLLQPQPPKQLQSLLSVEIPTIEMERYSIMFGNILQKQQPQYQYFLQQAQLPQPSQAPPPPPQEQQTEKPQASQQLQKPEEAQQSQPPQNPKQPREPRPRGPQPRELQSKESQPKEPESMEPVKPQEPQERQESQESQQVLRPQQSPRPTLPVRRQVKLDNIKLPAAKDFRDASIHVEIVVPQRSTSPLPKGSPSFSLFPPDQAPANNNNLPPRVSSRRRSNTSPAGVNFPTPAMFKAPAVSRKRTTSVSTPPHDEPLPADSQTTPERRERLISKFHRKESPSEPNMPKVTEKLSESPASISAPTQPRSILKKPTGPPPPPPNRTAEPKTSPKTSPQQITPPKQHQHQLSKASIRSENEEEVEKALYEAVEISIARQISVSRQQRRMLVPLNRSASRRVPGEAAAEAAALIKPGENKRLAETRTATPLLVHPEEEEPNHGQGGYRKSSRVVLEGA